MINIFVCLYLFFESRYFKTVVAFVPLYDGPLYDNCFIWRFYLLTFREFIICNFFHFFGLINVKFIQVIGIMVGSYDEGELIEKRYKGHDDHEKIPEQDDEMRMII